MLQSRVIYEVSFTFVSIIEYVERDFKWAVNTSKHLGVYIYDNDEPYKQLVRSWNTVSDKWMAGDVLVVPPRDYQLRHLEVIPPARLAWSPATRLTCHRESDKLQRTITFLSLVRIKLTRNNHCERGFRIRVITSSKQSPLHASFTPLACKKPFDPRHWWQTRLKYVEDNLSCCIPHMPRAPRGAHSLAYIISLLRWILNSSQESSRPGSGMA